MKGIILAGGTGSRLKPLTNVTNKHLLPVGKYPMIFYSIYQLKQAGITEILVVTGREYMGDVIELLGKGEEAVMSIRNFGEKSLDELHEKMQEKGFLKIENQEDESE